MRVAITPTRQRNAVSEGVALGVLMSGRNVVPSDRFSVGLSVEGAWRAWAHRRVFPRVDLDLRQGLNGEIVMARATERKQTFALFWEHTSNGYEIFSRVEWPDGVDADYVAGLIDGDLPASAWKQLAEEIFGRLER